MTTPRTCRVCGCTDTHACQPPCWWVGPDLCSACGPRDFVVARTRPLGLVECRRLHISPYAKTTRILTVIHQLRGVAITLEDRIHLGEFDHSKTWRDALTRSVKASGAGDFEHPDLVLVEVPC